MGHQRHFGHEGYFLIKIILTIAQIFLWIDFVCDKLCFTSFIKWSSKTPVTLWVWGDIFSVLKKGEIRICSCYCKMIYMKPKMGKVFYIRCLNTMLWKAVSVFYKARRSITSNTYHKCSYVLPVLWAIWTSLVSVVQPSVIVILVILVSFDSLISIYNL